MRLFVDEEPTFDEIGSKALEMYGTNYLWVAMWPTSTEDNIRRVDMECIAERKLIRERMSAKQVITE